MIYRTTYNAVFGENKFAPALLAILKLNQYDDFGGGYRDAYVTDARRITVYARWYGVKEDDERFEKIRKHPHYWSDRTERPTYYEFEFHFDAEWLPVIETMWEHTLDKRSVEERWKEAKADIESGNMTTPYLPNLINAAMYVLD